MIFGTLTICIFLGCYSSPTEEKISAGNPVGYSFAHYPHNNPNSRRGDSLQWKRAYTTSNLAYQESLATGTCTLFDSIYIFNQISRNALSLKDTVILAPYLEFVDSCLRAEDIKQAHHLGLLADHEFNLGKWAMFRGAYREAKTYLHSALQQYERLHTPPHLRISQAQSELAAMYHTFHTSLDSAKLYAEKSARQYLYIPDLYAHHLDNEFLRAELAGQERNFLSGIGYLNKVIAELTHISRADTMFLVQCLNLKGKLLRKINDWEESYRFLQSAYQLWKQCCLQDLRGQEVYRELLFYHSYRGQVDSFHHYFNELTGRFSPVEMQFIVPDRILSNFYHDTQQYGRAISLQKKLLTDYENNPFADRELIQQAYYILTDSYRNLGHFDSAGYYSARRILLGAPPDTTQDQWDRIISREVALRPEQLVPYYQLIQNLYYQYQQEKNSFLLKRAFRLCQLTDTIVQNTFATIPEHGISSFLEQIHSIYAQSYSIEIAYELYKTEPRRNYMDWANRFMERTKSSLLYRDLLIGTALDNHDLSETWRKKEDELNAKIRAVSRKVINSEESGALANLLLEQKTLYESIASYYPEYYRARVFQEIPSLAEIQKKLRGTKQAILQYFDDGHKDFLLLIRSDTTLFLRLPADQTAHDALSDAKTLLFADTPIDIEKFTGLSHQIYEGYFAPAANYLSDITQLLIIPGHRLDQFPFETLLVQPYGTLDHHTPFLIKRFSVQYAHSLKNYWKHLHSISYQGNRSKKVLAYAFNDRDEVVGFIKDLPYLSGSPKELDDIKNNVRLQIGSRFVYGNGNRKAQFLKYAQNGGYDLIHLSLHARSNLRNRFDNHIYFRKLRNDIDTLYGFEIPPLRLTTELVVLSSCQTAYGPNQAGEGTYSLARSFIQSGAKAVISSLWNIEQSAANQLVHHLYTELPTATTPAEALHRAKLKLLDESADFFLDPRYWAALIYHCGG
ncbi:hypothetical protein CRP01_17530 [Flavilitoribacter nigricans DSM 23189 = NBRC 102662]|uniref:CHAT domain-containing protein n=1 Tax=Flavilitoribacter nigricans (strain ATCC 23147 / DSM 23189 / NBRC 102662 / NCIMB 1420 / SS-2) TaxID=1122177 RepID=A0A2D0NA08_FLAN2|nr:hypothetical protein CRP01_17530 [Flavilitoribacter nigricans DSM 23189 = NBRC 102662]